MIKIKTFSASVALAVSLALAGCSQAPENSNTATADEKAQSQETQTFGVEYERFTLDNGLRVILHVDRSDPVAAVALTAHVGSAREKEGRTGFAHLFEHLLFLESENLGKGGLDQLSARIGGSGANGSTSRDRTNYFQTVPIDALEKMIWAEADKLGFFINTVTEPVLAKEKQVVKNEKRQGVDNRPYGHTQYVIDKNLYPEGHPYSWQVIGSLEDLQAATLSDVKEFFNQWYVPNNVILTIAGDIDVEQTKAWVKKYFDEIPAGQDIERLAKQPAVLSESKKLFHEDNFARAPRLTMVWPTVPQYSPDYYPLSVLSQYMSQGKQAPLNQVLIDEMQVTSQVGMFGYNSEIAGQLQLSVTAFNEVNLNKVAEGIQKAFATFEQNGISEQDLKRIKAGQETGFYSSLSSVLGKGFQLAQYEIFAGDASFINQDVQNILAVTPEDVKRVYNTYIKDKPFVATSFVPKGQTELVLEGSSKAEVVEEKIVDGTEESFDASVAAEYERTPSSFDRSVEPPYGQSPDVVVPTVWQQTLASGIKVTGIENSEVPLVVFEMKIDGGMLLESSDKIGVSNLLSNILLKGTANKTPEQLEQEIELLGATLRANATDTSLVISGTVLSKNFSPLMNLVNEVILTPRFDENEFSLAKQDIISSIQRRAANPNAIARAQFDEILFGKGHPLSVQNTGTVESVESITLEDVTAYYTANVSPHLAKFHVAGDISQQNVIDVLAELNSKWAKTDASLPSIAAPKMPETANIYFYDVPGAKQSVLYFGHPGPSFQDPEYYAATVMNYRLGGGGFASQLTQELREGKGYTYGIRSGFNANNYAGTFVISSGVRSNVTLESLNLVRDILQNYAPNYSENDLDVTKSFTLKSNARAFETLNAKLNMVANISDYDLDSSYVKTREDIVKALTVEDMQRLNQSYIHPDKMIYVIVGDKATQLEKLKSAGLGDPILLNP